MATNILVTLVLGSLVALNAVEGCKYWCRRPMSFEYVCCDKGNPFVAVTQQPSEDLVASEPALTSSSSVDISTSQSTSEVQSSSCYYYCIYNGNVYCCDDGSGPIPPDHNTHDGRCPVKKEQVCKKGGIYLHVHASKMTTKTGTKKLSNLGTKHKHPVCASDGYCVEDEKCCQNICAKKHTCLKAIYDYDGFRKSVPKKKRTRNY